MSLPVGNVIIKKATGKAKQLGCKYGDFLKCERYNSRFTRQYNFCLGWATVIFYGTHGAVAECTSGEKSAAEKLKYPVLYANKIAGHARTAENANQQTRLCTQQLNVGLCAWHNQSCFYRNHSLLYIKVSYNKKGSSRETSVWSCHFLSLNGKNCWISVQRT